MELNRNIYHIFYSSTLFVRCADGGDWNGDGKTEIGLKRDSSYYLDYNGNGKWDGSVTDRLNNMGKPTDTGISGDWNHDGATEIGLRRGSAFYLDYSGNGKWDGATTDRYYTMGQSTDLPVTGDWNRDGTTEIGVFRPSSHGFYLDTSGNGAWGTGDTLYSFGQTGDQPVAEDWNNDGKTEIGVFRDGHSWLLDSSGDGAWGPGDTLHDFGTSGDIPIVGNWQDVPASAAPVADFTGTPLTGPAPLNVQFTDTSTGSPTSWSWDFGDGGTAITQNPSHPYAAAGTYDVSLTAGNGAGSNATVKGGYVVVTETCPYTCDITDPPNIDFGIDNVTFPSESGVWRRANCYDNALIRWAVAGESSSFYATLSPWIWKQKLCCPNPGHSFAVDSPYNKPIYIAGVKNMELTPVFTHAIDAEYLTSGNASESVWQDWRFFNYDSRNILIGDWQIPVSTSDWTQIWIRSVDVLPGEGQYDGRIWRTFYIAPNKSVFLHPANYYTESYAMSQSGKLQVNQQIVPDELNQVIKSMNNNKFFTLNKWEFNPENNELTVYAHDIKDQRAINDFQNISVGKYTIQMVYDKEFENNRADVRQQLVQFRNNPDYQIAGISMVTDRINDPPGNYAELWVYKSTPENKKLDNTVIQEWEILVYPIST